MDSYDILNVSRDSDDIVIRKAYLALVLEYPPERDQKRFTQINEAYQKIKTKEMRIKKRLFDMDFPFDSPFGAVTNHVINKKNRQPMQSQVMKEFLQECARNSKTS